MDRLPNQVRIIGGKWRGRKIRFSASSDIRPSTDFVRETLFNWLAPYINGATCLDLFAGSGALGFEALSRDAKHVVMVDKSPQTIEDLRQNAKLFGATNIELICLNFSPHTKNPFSTKFDIVFLDPPFHQNLVAPCCKWLEQSGCLADDALIYIEAEKTLSPLPIPAGWQIHRCKIAGQVSYSLAHIAKSIGVEN